MKSIQLLKTSPTALLFGNMCLFIFHGTFPMSPPRSRKFPIPKKKQSIPYQAPNTQANPRYNELNKLHTACSSLETQLTIDISRLEEFEKSKFITKLEDLRQKHSWDIIYFYYKRTQWTPMKTGLTPRYKDYEIEIVKSIKRTYLLGLFDLKYELIKPSY